MMEAPLIAFKGQQAYRIIPSRYPTICIYEDVANADELEAVWAIEALTNDRLREEAGDLTRVAKEDWLVGLHGGSYVMAAFTHLNPEGARFTTGDFGGYYCAPLLDTAVKETVYHQERIFGYTKEPAQKVQMRVLHTEFCANLADISGEDFLSTPLYHATDYSHSQAFAKMQKGKAMDGIHYRSVRHSGHHCHVLYRPCLVTRIHQAQHLEYHWNGNAIANVLEIKLYGE
ncbi:RES family NAD+ phosphorylase [Aeromonas rivuli]|uniref:RES family NAD+ phosphorylase n=1 Tax=Aeromonas TaxID=642 RepID=UPI0005A6DC35|nr:MULTISPECIES: RES family NAD+ phosphorylase [Aeromonas]